MEIMENTEENSEKIGKRRGEEGEGGRRKEVGRWWRRRRREGGGIRKHPKKGRETPTSGCAYAHPREPLQGSQVAMIVVLLYYYTKKRKKMRENDVTSDPMTSGQGPVTSLPVAPQPRYTTTNVTL